MTSFKANLKKAMCILLIGILLSVFLSIPAFANRTSSTKTIKVTNEEGIEWTIKIDQFSFGKKISLTSESRKDNKYVLSINSDTSNVVVTTYESKEQALLNAYQKKDVATFKIPEYKEQQRYDSISGQMNWNSKTYERYKKKYFYRFGTSAYGNTYFQIGCKAIYDIPYYKLSNSKKNECKEYKNAINKVNSNWNKMRNSYIAGFCTEAIGIALAVISAGTSVVISTLVSSLGITVTGATYAANCASAYQDVKDTYVIIRGYAKK